MTNPCFRQAMTCTLWRIFFSPSSLSTSLSSSPPPLILSTHTLHSVCSTDFLPPVSPPFYPPHLSSPLPMQLHFVDPNFPFTPSLLPFYPLLHLTSLYLSHCSVYHLPATSSSSIAPPFCFFLPSVTDSSSHLAPQHPRYCCLRSFLLSHCLLSSSFCLPIISFLFVFLFSSLSLVCVN